MNVKNKLPKKRARYAVARVLFIFILVFAAFLRIYKLGSVPSSVTNDELIFIYNGYSIFKTGKDLVGNFLPWITNIAVPFTPVYSYIVAPFVGIFGLNAFWGRFPNVLLGLGHLVLVYLIFNKIFRNQKLSLLTLFVLAVSPWHLQLTRSAYDVISATFFYLFTILLFLEAFAQTDQKRKYLLYSLCSLPLFLALYSYRATNLIYFPVIFSLLVFAFGQFKKKIKELGYFVLISVMIFSLALVINKQHGTDYTKEAFNGLSSALNMVEAHKIVDHEIANAQAPLIVSRIFNNKLTYALRIFRENYLGAFSIEYLFTKGEAQPIYNLWWRGVLYLIELPLILLGIFYLLQLNKKGFVFIVLSLILAPLPSGIAGPTYVSRAFYMIFFTSVLTAGGILQITHWLKKNQLKYPILAMIFLLYSLHIASYLYQYYARYAIYGAEAWFRSTKEVSQYVAQQKEQKIIYANSTFFEVVNYAFYKQIKPERIQNVYLNGYKNNRFRLENIEFRQDCLNNGEGNPQEFLPNGTIYVTRFRPCHKEYDAPENIRRYNGKFTPESEIIWKIYHGKKNVNKNN